MLFSAELFARTWRAVALAASDDPHRPALFRAVSIDVFRDAVMLTSTDSYLLLNAAVPVRSDDIIDLPDNDEEPISNVIAIDADGRLDAMLKHATKLAKLAEKSGEDSPELRVEVLSPNAAMTLDPTMAARTVRFVLTGDPIHGREEITLPTFDGEYPNWRTLAANWNPESPDHIGVGRAVARMVKLLDMFDMAEMRWDLGGVLGGIKVRFEDGDSGIIVHGISMPVRLEEDRDLPTPADRAAGPIGRFEADMGWGVDGDEPLDVTDLVAAEDDPFADIFETPPETVVPDEDLMGRAVGIVVREDTCSVAFLMDRLGIDKDAASKIIADLDDIGIVTPDGEVDGSWVVLYEVSNLSVALSWLHAWQREQLHEVDA